MLHITSLHHVAVCVTDIARSKSFYGGILGLKEVDRPAFPFEGAWYEMGDGRQLHLIVHEHPRTLRARSKHVAGGAAISRSRRMTAITLGSTSQRGAFSSRTFPSGSVT